MLILEVVISRRVYRKVGLVAQYVTHKTSEANAKRYATELIGEILGLSIYARGIKQTDSDMLKVIHPNAKSITTKNKKWRIIFHVEGDKVYVDDLIASSMITQ